MPLYDAIVVGTGGVGSAALFHLAARGARVLGLDRFPPGHDRGSSHGHTRVIRQAYFEHPDYVPLLRRAYTLWDELAARDGQALFERAGLLQIGPPDGAIVPGVLASARQHNLPVEELGPDEVERRFKGFRVPEGAHAVFERDAGYLLVEECVRAHARAAEGAGAEIRSGIAVRSWHAEGTGAVVETDAGSFSAGRLVIAAGAWAGSLLAELGVPLRVVRKHLHWYAADAACYRRENGCPAFFYEHQHQFFYGFPRIDERGVKVAEHSGGESVADPLAVDRSVDPEDRRRVEESLGRFLPRVSRRPTDHTVCLYTMSPDEHFIVDRHPEHEAVAFAAGLSGHGFKFTSVLGEILAALVLDGRTEQPVGFLNCRRFRA
jgi:monomeric sarcosine oxidase